MSGHTEIEAPYPASWWESRTSEQLQEFVRAGFISGDHYYCAQRELERRARESTRLADQAAEEEVEQRVTQGFRGAVIAAISFAVAIFALVWMLTTR